MHSATKNKSFTEGPLFSKIFLYVIPIMLTGILQLCYNMADHIVVGRFSGDANALGAVGCTSSLTGLVTNLLIGISAGAGVAVAQAFGAKDNGRVGRTVHTSMTFSFIGGIVFMGIGLLVSAPALRLMGTQAEFFEQAVLYMRIICLGIPASAVYNFGASILRAVGDSRTPLIILSSTGVVNVIFNLFFVIVCGMSVDGVALATIISQYLSALGVVFILVRRKSEVYALSFKKIGIHKGSLIQMLKFGVPAGVQSSLFSISNVIITSAVNGFPPETVNAKTIATNMDSFLYVTLNSYLHASMTFSAQNYGAKKLERVKKSVIYTIIQALVIGISLGAIMLLVCNSISGIFVAADNPSRDVILARVYDIMKVTSMMYFMCGIQEALSGALRGLGHSVLPMIMSIGGICGVRMIWIFGFTARPPFNTISGVYLCYPISWTVTAIGIGTALIVTYRGIKKRLYTENLK